MNIYLSCLQTPASYPIPAYQFWEIYFKNGITEGGHSWTETPNVDWVKGLACQDEAALHKWKGETWESVVEDIKRKHSQQAIDLFLGYLYPKHVDTAAIREIQKIGIPCINFFCDNVREFTKIPEVYRVFDLHWVPEYKALKLYQQAKLPYVYAPMPMWVDPVYRSPSTVENNEISFIGSADIQRIRLLAKIADAELPLRISGAGWTGQGVPVPAKSQRHFADKVKSHFRFCETQGGPAYVRWMCQRLFPPSVPSINKNLLSEFITEKEYIALTRESLITLGINRYPSFRHPLSRPDTYSRLRDLEAPMLGACYVTEWTEGIELMYEVGQEIETYKTAEEMVAKIRDLYKFPARRMQLRKAGQLRALREHSLTRTIEKFQQKLYSCKPV